MKLRIAIYITAISLLITLLNGCTVASSPYEQDPLDDYRQMLSGDIPEDLCLTIYYMDPLIFTRIALTTDGLMSHPETKKIIVKADQLEDKQSLLKKLDSSLLQPAAINSYVNARMYYVFETAETGKLLEVIVNQVYGNVFVNGIEAEENPVFLEIVTPFLPEQARILFKDREPSPVFDELALEYGVPQHHQALFESWKHWKTGWNHTHIYNIHVPFK